MTRHPDVGPTDTSRRVSVAAALDVVGVVLFVALGRRSHQRDGAWLPETLRVVGPFLIALAVAWLVVRAWRRPSDPWTTGVPVWLITAAGGLLARRFLFHRSTALAFVVVASIVTGAVLVGWRVLATARAGD